MVLSGMKLHKIILPILTTILVICFLWILLLKKFIIGMILLPLLFLPLLSNSGLFLFLQERLMVLEM